MFDWDSDSDDCDYWRSTKSCRFGGGCLRPDCTFSHPPGRPPACNNPSGCKKYGCKRLHFESRVGDCRFGENCHGKNCQFLHPRKATVAATTSSSFSTVSISCRYGAECSAFDCTFIHPTSRAQKCNDGMNCDAFGCSKLHPKGRTRDCMNGAACGNRSKCAFRHPAFNVLATEFKPMSMTASEFVPAGFMQPEAAKHGNASGWLGANASQQGVEAEFRVNNGPCNSSTSQQLQQDIFFGDVPIGTVGGAFYCSDHYHNTTVIFYEAIVRNVSEKGISVMERIVDRRHKGSPGEFTKSRFLPGALFSIWPVTLVINNVVSYSSFDGGRYVVDIRATKMQFSSKMVPTLMEALQSDAEDSLSTLFTRVGPVMDAFFSHLITTDSRDGEEGGLSVSELTELLLQKANFISHQALFRGSETGFQRLIRTRFFFDVLPKQLKKNGHDRVTVEKVLDLVSLLGSLFPNCMRFLLPLVRALRDLRGTDAKVQQLVWQCLEKMAIAQSVDTEMRQSSDGKVGLEKIDAGSAHELLPWHALPLVPDMSPENIAKQQGAAEGCLMERSLLPRLNRVFDSEDDYLETNFRLLRANCFLKLAEGIAARVHNKSIDTHDMALYQITRLGGLHLLKIASHNGGFAISIECVPIEVKQQVSSNAGPRAGGTVRKKLKPRNLMIGTLVGISSTLVFQKHVHWGQVTERNANADGGVTVVISFFPKQHGAFLPTGCLFRQILMGGYEFLIESPVYYQAYGPVLEVLQAKHTEDVQGKFKSKFNMLQVLSGSEGGGRAAQKPPAWQEKAIERLEQKTKMEGMRFDPCQQLAIHQALSSRVSCVQGPPGSGKSYVGVALTDCVLHGMGSAKWKSKSLKAEPSTVERRKQVLILAHKNHILDEMLADIMDLPSKPEVVRIGARSGHERLQSRTLKELCMATPKASDLAFEQSDLLNEKAGAEKLLAELMSHYVEAVSPSALILKYASDQQLCSILHRNPDTKTKILHGQRVELQAKSIEEAVKDWLGEAFGFGLPSTEEWAAGSAAKDDDDEDGLTASQERQEYSAVAEKSVTIPMDFKWPSTPEHHKSDMWEYIALGTVNLCALTNLERIQLMSGWRSMELNAIPADWEQLLADLFAKHDAVSEKLAALERRHQVRVLSRCADVVGCTVTGAAVNSRLLAQLRCEVVLVEESGEVLEPLLAAAVQADTQQLIQIGDPRQLRPLVEHYGLKQHHELDVSMMERLFRLGNYPTAKLKMQCRMPEELSQLWQLVRQSDTNAAVYDYTVGTNAEVLRKKTADQQTQVDKLLQEALDLNSTNGNVNTVIPRMFWVNTQTSIEPESSVDRGKTNEKEAYKIVQLATHLIRREGLPPKSVTILSMYLAQTQLLRRLLQEAGMGKEVSCHPVDRFQGDEADLVLLSLVRSNTEGKLGFASVPNRVVVGLSRQRRGLIVFGNAEIFEQNSPSQWAPVVRHFRANNALGDVLPLRCTRHPESRLALGEYCRHICNQKRSGCGHVCEHPCHPEGQHPPCRAQILDTFLRCGHSVARECCMPIGELVCKEVIDYMQPDCKHVSKIVCHKKSNGIVPCMQQVNVVCGSCQGSGSMMCYAHKSDPLSYRCEKPCMRKMSCGHPCLLKCFEICDNGLWRCMVCKEEREQRTKELRRSVEEQIQRIKNEDAEKTDAVARLINIPENSQEFKELAKTMRSFVSSGDDLETSNSGDRSAGKAKQPQQSVTLLSAEKIKNIRLESEFFEAARSTVALSEVVKRLIPCADDAAKAQHIARKGSIISASRNTKARASSIFVDTLTEFPKQDEEDDCIYVLCDVQPGFVKSSMDVARSNGEEGIEGFDTYIDEHRGLHRFWHPSLVLPRAIVHVRLKNLSMLGGDVAVPSYWSNAISSIGSGTHAKSLIESDLGFLVEETSEDIINEILKMMRSTSHPSCLGRDGAGGTDKAEILKVYRNENPLLWKQYAHRRNAIREKNQTSYGSDAKPLQPPVPVVMLMRELRKKDSKLTMDLDGSVNEHFLWHGTSRQIAEKIICKFGFDERVAATSGLYGAGSYYAEEACKSAQYAPQESGVIPSSSNGSARTSGGGTVMGVRCMLLCRVVLGEPYYTKTHLNGIRRPPTRIQSQLKSRTLVDAGDVYDSVVANAGAKGTYSQAHRELIVYDRSQAYPEWMILFRTS